MRGLRPSGIDPSRQRRLARGEQNEPLYDILRRMIKALKQALVEVERLPEADQETIGRQVLTHVQKLRLLRSDIDEGIRSLDAGEGRELDMRDVVSRARKQA